MHLTLGLLIRRNVVPGHQWVGKHRLPYVAYPWHLERLDRRLKIEEQNLFYLRHPYLTLAQEREGGTAAGHKEKKQNFIATKQLLRASQRQVQLSKRMEDHLGHLNVSTNWETYK